MRVVNEGITAPDDLDRVENGKLPAALLRPFEAKWLFHHRACDLFGIWFDTVYAETGWQLKVIAGISNSYRSYEAQVQLFYQRFREDPAGRQMFAGKRWSLKPGMASAAVPVGGSFLINGVWKPSAGSNHGWGLSGDMCFVGERAINARERIVLDQIGARFGIRSTTPSENWHFSCLNVQVWHPTVFGSTEGPIQPPVTPPPPDPPAAPIPTEDLMIALYRPTFASPGYDPAWFAVFASGAVRRATNADVALAKRLAVPTIDLDSPDQYDDLLAVSGSTYPARSGTNV